MFEFLFGDIFHHAASHEVSLFPKVDESITHAMGLDSTSTSHSPTIDGPVEYVFRVAVFPAIANGEGSLTQTGTTASPLISFVGPHASTDLIPIKAGFKSGQVGEFSVITKDVGPVTSIKLANPNAAKNDQWYPTSVQVNRMGASNGKNGYPHADGWVNFDVNKAIREPVTIQANSGVTPVIS